MPLSRCGSWGSEKLSGVPEVTQPRSVGLRLKPTYLSLHPVLFPCIFYPDYGILASESRVDPSPVMDTEGSPGAWRHDLCWVRPAW